MPRELFDTPFRHRSMEPTKGASKTRGPLQSMTLSFTCRCDASHTDERRRSREWLNLALDEALPQTFSLRKYIFNRSFEQVGI